MKVLHINCNYLGSALHQNMIENLDELGIENYVFVPTYDKNIAVIEPNSNVYVAECFKKWDRILFDYKQQKILNAIERKYDVSSFDLIHAYTLYTDGNVARILSEKYGVPYVVAVRNTDINVFFKKMIHLRKRGIKTLLSSKHVFFLSNSYRNFLLEKYLDREKREKVSAKSLIIPNGIDKFWLENTFKDRDYAKISESIREKQIKILYVGNIDKNKNITTTCGAKSLLEEKGWNVDFSVVGKICDNDVFDVIKSQVTYFTSRPKEELIDIYRSADLFVMPSLTETFGLVYVEAMTQGLPIIYSKGQGFDGQYLDKYVGVSVEAKNAEDIASAIEVICDEYYCMSNNAIVAASRFNWSDICRQYNEIYSEVLS